MSGAETSTKHLYKIAEYGHGLWVIPPSTMLTLKQVVNYGLDQFWKPFIVQIYPNFLFEQPALEIHKISKTYIENKISHYLLSKKCLPLKHKMKLDNVASACF